MVSFLKNYILLLMLVGCSTAPTVVQPIESTAAYTKIIPPVATNNVIHKHILSAQPSFENTVIVTPNCVIDNPNIGSFPAWPQEICFPSITSSNYLVNVTFQSNSTACWNIMFSSSGWTLVGYNGSNWQILTDSNSTLDNQVRLGVGSIYQQLQVVP